jgi:hypothetical protein
MGVNESGGNGEKAPVNSDKHSILNITKKIIKKS